MLESFPVPLLLFFFLKDPAPPDISPLPLHAALPIFRVAPPGAPDRPHREPQVVAPRVREAAVADDGQGGGLRRPPRRGLRQPHDRVRDGGRPRSEEHTSELQSRLHLVCRLLLEKKKK